MAGYVSWSYAAVKNQGLLYPNASLNSLLSVPSQQEAEHITPELTDRDKTDTTSGLT